MSQELYDLVVIGAGPGGYAGAIRAAQLGLKVALIEKREGQHLGGTCLNVGCIPTKSLLESAKTWEKLSHASELGFNIGNPTYDWQRIMDRKDKIVDTQRKGLQFLMKKNKIEVFYGAGRLESKTQVSVTDKAGKKEVLNCKFILLATGSKVRELPIAKANGTTIFTSDSVLFIDQVPKSLCIIGGGIVGMEFASLFGRFGTQVTVLEGAPQVLPSLDEECAKELVKHLRKQNVTVEAGVTITAVEDSKGQVVVKLKGAEDRRFDRVLVSVGRAPVTEDLGLEKVGLSTDRGYIKTDAHYLTAVANIFAIGDILTTPALAHTATAEAVHAAEVIAGLHPKVIDYQTNPNAVYTYPEVASVGMTEKELREKGIEYKIGKFPFMPMAKAKIEDGTEGFVKILFDPIYHELLGFHIVGAKATEMIGEFVLGKILETTVDEIGRAIHPHPTLSEASMEAAHAALGHAIHG